jgi:hypothetical protein
MSQSCMTENRKPVIKTGTWIGCTADGVYELGQVDEVSSVLLRNCKSVLAGILRMDSGRAFTAVR